MRKALPKYRLKINPDKQKFVRAVALVGSPAMESNYLKFDEDEPQERFVAFSKEQKDITFSQDEELREVIGAAIIPDKYIYRKDKKTGKEYEVYFTKEDIVAIAQDFMLNGRQANMNLEHSDKPADSFIYQTYIVDHARGQFGPPSLKLSEGTLVQCAKVLNDEVWEGVNNGTYNGFSIEGIFDLYEEQFSAAISEEEQATINMLLAMEKLLSQQIQQKLNQPKVDKYKK